MAGVPANRWIVFFSLAAAGCGLDLATKHAMFSWPKLRQGEIHWIWPQYAGFQLSLNEGALFGMGQGAQMWFALLSVIAALAIPLWLFRFGAAKDLRLTIILGCILGGVLGNLYDRAGLHHLVWGQDWAAAPDRHHQPIYAVRDWILLQWSNEVRWPNFNIADCLLVVGAAAIFLCTLYQKEPPQHSTSEPAGE